MAGQQYLVTAPAAARFLDIAQIDSGVKALLGDLPQIDETVRTDVAAAHVTLRDAVTRVAALADDPTRTVVEKHAVAKQLADKVVTKLTAVRQALHARSEALRTDALKQADYELGPRSERAALHSEIRTWIRETAQHPEQMDAIRAAVKDNADVAAVIWHSPQFLTGLAPDVHDEYRAEAMRAHQPRLAGMIDQSVHLSKLAATYGRTIATVPSSFYNPEQAAKASKRVEVG